MFRDKKTVITLLFLVGSNFTTECFCAALSKVGVVVWEGEPPKYKLKFLSELSFDRVQAKPSLPKTNTKGFTRDVRENDKESREDESGKVLVSTLFGLIEEKKMSPLRLVPKTQLAQPLNPPLPLLQNPKVSTYTQADRPSALPRYGKKMKAPLSAGLMKRRREESDDEVTEISFVRKAKKSRVLMKTS